MIKSLTDREYQKFKELTDNSPAVKTFSMNTLIPKEFDSIVLTYSGSNVTSIKYYVGGTSGTLVATLTLGYTGSNVTSIVRT